MQVQACMIDLDGTLVDTMGDFDAEKCRRMRI
jgi:phosphoglycolate phosphatase-like HAD superfamily hydrolase